MTTSLDRMAWTSRWRDKAVAEKAVLAFGLLALALALPPWPGAALILIIAWTAALAGAGLDVRAWARLNATPMGFVLAGCLAVAVELGPDGIGLAPDHGRAAAELALRASGAAACLLLLAATTPTPEILAGLRRLGLPPELAELSLLIWRFVFLMLDAAGAIRAAQEARLGWDGWGRSLRSAGLLIAALLPRAMERARRMEIGLAARGLDGGALPVLEQARPASIPALGLILAGQGLLAGACLWLS